MLCILPTQRAESHVCNLKNCYRILISADGGGIVLVWRRRRTVAGKLADEGVGKPKVGSRATPKRAFRTAPLFFVERLSQYHRPTAAAQAY